MKTAFVATLIASLLVGGAAATLVAVRAPVASSMADMAGMDHAHSHAAGADEHALHGGMAGDAAGMAHDHAQSGMIRPAFPPATGSVPSAQDAKSLEEVSSLQVIKDKGFNPKNGVRSGSGTLLDPYVISGYYVTGDLYLGDTDSCFLVTDNYIAGQLSLNWNGLCVWVHHNFIGDLRVNENVRRTGDDTGGLIELNQIGYVGQIRHYDGEFRNNVVGPRPSGQTPFNDPENQLPFAQDTRVLNIDGFNEGWFHHNTIYGSTDLKLHGHHHSTGFLATHSHYHGDDAAKMADMAHDHTDRWESVVFESNKIVDPTGYGLRYTDEAHAGDDQTATSETTKQLEDPHQHHTDVTIANNELQGSGIWVDILNADDSLHKVFNPAWLTISGNSIALKSRQSDGLLGTQFFGNPYEANTGIKLWDAKEAWIAIRDNTVTWSPDSGSSSSDPAAPVTSLVKPVVKPLAPFLFPDDTPVAISLQEVRSATLSVTGNHASGFEYGLRASQMDNKTSWYVSGNDFGAAQHGTYWDDSVEHKPTPIAPVFPDPHLDLGDQPYDKLPTTQTR